MNPRALSVAYRPKSRARRPHRSRIATSTPSDHDSPLPATALAAAESERLSLGPCIVAALGALERQTDCRNRCWLHRRFRPRHRQSGSKLEMNPRWLSGHPPRHVMTQPNASPPPNYTAETNEPKRCNRESKLQKLEARQVIRRMSCRRQASAANLSNNLKPVSWRSMLPNHQNPTLASHAAPSLRHQPETRNKRTGATVAESSLRAEASGFAKTHALASIRRFIEDMVRSRIHPETGCSPIFGRGTPWRARPGLWAAPRAACPYCVPSWSSTSPMNTCTAPA